MGHTVEKSLLSSGRAGETLGGQCLEELLHFMGHRDSCVPAQASKHLGETWEGPHIYPLTQGKQGVTTAELPLDGALWTEPVCEEHDSCFLYFLFW